MYLSTCAILVYVLIYTPLKKHTPLALLIGAIPGAIPPLLGWVAATGEIGNGGMALFAILLVWQLPHFIAITLYLNSDYRRAGIRTVAVVRGEWAAKAQALAYATLLIPVSLLPVTAGLGGTVYTVIVLLAGMGFWYMGLMGFRKDAGAQWARRFFMTSLAYLPVLTIALYLDVIV
jgi:protoheme IX farnesyltransferase